MSSFGFDLCLKRSIIWRRQVGFFMDLVWCVHSVLTESKSVCGSPQAFNEMRFCRETNQSLLCEDPVFSGWRGWSNPGPQVCCFSEFSCPSVACACAPETLQTQCSLWALCPGFMLCCCLGGKASGLWTEAQSSPGMWWKTLEKKLQAASIRDVLIV